MSQWPQYDTVEDYLAERLQAALPQSGLTIYASSARSLEDYLNGTAIEQPAVFINYDGFQYTQQRESGSGAPMMVYSIFFHARYLDGYATTKAITAEMRRKKTFEIDGESFNARVAGGRHLLFDRGFDSYQLDIQIN